MGNTASASTEEQNEAVGKHAIELFRELDIDADNAISAEEWEKAFQSLDADGNGVISRKEWFINQKNTEMYDAIHKKSSAHITREEWQVAFGMLDVNKDGSISVAEWMSRRKVRLGFVPLGLAVSNWGVSVGDDSDFYEVIAAGWTAKEMVVAGPKGLIALGDFAKEEGAKERWLGRIKATIDEGKRPEGQWVAEKGEPRARPGEVWQDLEQVGWTMRADEEIEAWIHEWVAEHPDFRAMDALGRECNDQTFAIAFIGWLTGTDYSRVTDNTKGRAVVYGGLALLATAGVGLFLANRMSRGGKGDTETQKGSKGDAEVATRREK